MSGMELILASASPRRRELLQLITGSFRVVTSEVEETQTAQTPAALAGILSAEKCRAVAALYPHACVLGCDTVVECDGETLGKPHDAQQAAAMLQKLSGKTHCVHTGVTLCAAGQESGFVETTRVTFAPLPAQEVTAYTATAEPYDKAGGYGIQGWAARYITRIEGCYYNVMGLPVARLYALLRTIQGLQM